MRCGVPKETAMNHKLLASAVLAALLSASPMLQAQSLVGDRAGQSRCLAQIALDRAGHDHRHGRRRGEDGCHRLSGKARRRE